MIRVRVRFTVRVRVRFTVRGYISVQLVSVRIRVTLAFVLCLPGGLPDERILVIEAER